MNKSDVTLDRFIYRKNALAEQSRAEQSRAEQSRAEQSDLSYAFFWHVSEYIDDG